MKRLIAEIGREPPRRAWNAVDRSEPTKWRRAATKRAPRRVAIFHGLPNAPQNVSQSAKNGHYRLIFGCLKAVALALVYVLIIGRPGHQCCGRLGSRRASNCPAG